MFKKCGLALIFLFTAFCTTTFAQRPDLVRVFQQIVPPGAIAAIDSPRYVPASQAKIDRDTWILGIEIGGEKRAYSLNLLNRHEVVNDEIAGVRFCAVW